MLCAALRAFDEVGRLFERDRVERLPDVVRRAASTLWLRDPGPLYAALGLAGPSQVASPNKSAAPAAPEPDAQTEAAL